MHDEEGFIEDIEFLPEHHEKYDINEVVIRPQFDNYMQSDSDDEVSQFRALIEEIGKSKIKMKPNIPSQWVDNFK